MNQKEEGVVNHDEKNNDNDKKRPHPDAEEKNDDAAMSTAAVASSWPDVVPRIPVPPHPAARVHFFQEYIAQRRPCVLTGLPPSIGTTTTSSRTSTRDTQHRGEPTHNNNNTKIWQKLADRIQAETRVQVERRLDRNQSFGQNRTAAYQVDNMKWSEWMQHLRSPQSHLYYLSVQQQPPPTNTSPDDEDPPPKAHHGPPALANLKTTTTAEDTTNSIQKAPGQQLVEAGVIPATLPWAGPLILQSLNLWMGSTGSSRNDNPPDRPTHSGLHHDFHDNFYLVLAGRKRFHLYAPSDWPHLQLYGQVERVHPNGLISYRRQPTRSDGVPWSLLSIPQSTVDNSAGPPVGARPLGAIHPTNRHDQHEKEVDDGDDDDDDEEVVLGKGFDYVSDDDWNPDPGKDDFDDLDGDDDEEEEDEVNIITTERTRNDDDDDQRRPDHFSRIDPLLPREELTQKYPDFAKCRAWVLEVQAGESLYLPASYFHCVESLGDDDDNEGIHMAINYWYHPPDNLTDHEKPYLDDFWANHGS